MLHRNIERKKNSEGNNITCRWKIIKRNKGEKPRKKGGGEKEANKNVQLISTTIAMVVVLCRKK